MSVAALGRIVVGLAGWACVCVACGVEPPVVWEVTSGIKAPESAYWDADSGFLFLSQIGEGGGNGKDGDGWISKLTPDGKVFHVSKSGEATLLLALPQGAADHAYLADLHRLILPRMLENRVTAYDLSKLFPK